MFQPAANNVILHFKTKWIKNFGSLMKLASIQNGASVDPADCVNVVAEVVALPKKIDQYRRDFEGFTMDDLKVGDTVICRFDVIYDTIQLGPDTEPIFKNEIFWKGKSYFSASINKIFARVRGEDMKMLNGYVMVDQIAPPSNIILPTMLKRNIEAATARVCATGNSLEGERGIFIEKGDWVCYHPTRIQIYQTGGKPYGILKQKDILGVSTAYRPEIILN